MSCAILNEHGPGAVEHGVILVIRERRNVPMAGVAVTHPLFRFYNNRMHTFTEVFNLDIGADRKFG